ncbi:MAG: SUMF1/EgtB/PvdO family nonheme iron enzyme [Spirochaetia bacterium]
MPKQDKPSPQSPPDDAGVRLKPILGIRPGQYLAVIYGIVLLLAVYFLLFFPGISHRGAYLSVRTFPEHATVKVDGVYAGSTPCTIFLPRGERSVQILRPYYAPTTISRSVRGRVFATLIVPDRSRFSTDLQLADIDGLVKWALSDFQKNPEIPQILSEASWAAAAAGTREKLFGLLSDSLLSATDESQLREVLLAAARVSANGAFLTPGSFLDVVQRSAELSQRADNFPAWAMLAASRAQQTRLAPSPWIQQYVVGYREAISRYYQPGSAVSPSSGGGAGVAGMAFRSIPSGDLVMGKDDNLDSLGKSIDRLLAHPVRIEAFYLGTTEVTNEAFQAFIAENPDWSPANRGALVQKGLVTDAYLPDWKSGAPPAGTSTLPVTSVSWHAADAYCQWLSRRVQSALPGYAARLPSEAEWEWAARGGIRGMPYPLGGKPGGAVFFKTGISGPSPAGASEPNGYGLRDMLGNVWEWCADPFSINTNVLSSLDPRVSAALEKALPDSLDRSVRGGSWADQPGTDKVYTRGAQPADWCTPYLGFRVALARP